MKVVVAYSGGLDTSIIVKWVKETYDAEVIGFCADVGQEEELDGVEEKAINTGATKCYVEDLNEEFAKDFIFPMMQANAIYEGSYLLGTSLARPLIAKEQVRIAELPDDAKGDYSGPKHRSQQVLNSLLGQLYVLPCEVAAERLLSDMAGDTEHPWWRTLPGFVEYDIAHDDLLRLMANTDDQKLQLLALPAIQNHPTAARRKLLQQLIASQHSEVKAAASLVKAALNDLKNATPTPRMPLETDY